MRIIRILLAIPIIALLTGNALFMEPVASANDTAPITFGQTLSGSIDVPDEYETYTRPDSIEPDVKLIGPQPCILYSFPDVQINKGETLTYSIEVPETQNLFITLQKTTLVSYGSSWSGELSILFGEEKITSTRGSHDFISHIVEPEPGTYTINITASKAGSGILNVWTSLPELPVGEWVVGTIHCSYGSTWYQVEAPSNLEGLYFEAEAMGLWSHFDIYYGEYDSSRHWVSRQGTRTSIEIPNPAPGTYIVQFMDSAMLWSAGKWSQDQSRDVLIKVGAMKEYGGVYLPLGDISFADQIIDYQPGERADYPCNNPQAALGPPDYKDDENDKFCSLGDGGNLTLKFDDNYLIDIEGDDLYIFEIGEVEPFRVEISKDGESWVDLGVVKGQPTGLDIAGKVEPGERFSYVRMTDVNAALTVYPWAGADIDAVGAIGARETEFAPPGYQPSINSLSFTRGGNTGPVTLEIKGGWLNAEGVVSLTRSGHEDIIAQTVYGGYDGASLTATFDLAGQEPGEWNLVVANPDGQSATAPSSFIIEQGGKAELWLEIVGREKIRAGRSAQYILRYGNSGDVDMPAPLFVISTSGTTSPILLISKSILPIVFKEETIKILGKGAAGSPGILPPGSAYNIQFFLKTEATNAFNIQVSPITANPVFQGHNLTQFWDAFCPAPGSPLGFSRVFPQDSINSSYLGPLGHGWVHNCDIHLEELSDGTVALVNGDSYSRFFLSNKDGTYTSLRSYDTLTRNPDDTFQIKEKNGTAYHFLTDLRLDYMEDANGNRLSAVYNAKNQLSQLQHSCGDSFSLEYNEHGRLSRLIDHANRVTQYQYDESGELLVSVTTPDGEATIYSYTNNGDSCGLDSITYPEGIQQFYKYNSDGQLSGVYLDGEEELVRYSYDVASGTTYIQDAENNITVVHVEEFGQINWLENPLGAVSRYDYDRSLNLVQSTDPLGNIYDFVYDGRGNNISITDPLDNQISMEYEPSYNKPTRLRDARTNETVFNYDEHSNLTSMTYPDSTTESVNYDAAGNPASITTRAGDNINYAYNGNGQLVRKDYPDGSWVAYEYDNAGNMSSATDASGTIYMEYNIRDQLTKIVYPSGRSLSYNHDNAGRLIQQVDQDSNTLNYEYDAASRLVRMSDGNDSDIVLYEYDAVGRLTKKTVASGAYTTYEYDAAGQILHLVNYNAASEVLSRFDYTYDLAGKPVSVNTLEGTYSYEYDSIGQLTQVTYPGGNEVSYSYDAAGNRIAVVDNGATTSYSTNNMNQYTEVGNAPYAYDANGNLISKTEDGQTTTYEYNYENRITRVISPEGTWEYVYDALDNRVAMIHDGIEHRYLVDPMGLGDVVAEYDGDGNLITRYIHGLGLISQINSSGDSYYYHFNLTGHTQQITDEAGTVVNSYKYSPFGKYLEKQETVPNPFGYVGEFGVMDDGNGMNYMRMRYYESAIGRFITVDPSGIAAGDPNVYRYASNSPILKVDPSGGEICMVTVMLFTGCMLYMLNNWVLMHGPEIYQMTQFLSQIPVYSPSIPEGLGGYIGFIAFNPQAITNLIWQTEMSIVNTLQLSWQGWQMLGEAFYDWLGRTIYELAYKLATRKLPVNPVKSTTPEDKYGPAGSDPPDTPAEERQRFVPADQHFYYKVDYWNKEDATAPACDVLVKDQLDTDLDWSTLRFEEFGFLSWIVELDPCQYFNINVDARPDMDLIVNVEGAFNPDTGEINWTFRSLDPDTMEIPEDPMAGFLPPITDDGYEIGWVCFSADPETDLPERTTIENQAFVEFDFAGDLYDHPAPKEGPWLNTIDSSAPAIISTLPQNGDINVDVNSAIKVTFSEAVDSSTITCSSLTLSDGVFPGTVAYDVDTYTAIFTPDGNLEYNHEFTATLNTDITDIAGNPLSAAYSWSFGTEEAGVVVPPPNFVIYDLTVTPSEVKPAEQVKISVVVKNTGGTDGIHTVILTINDVEEARKAVNVGAGRSETVNFLIAKDTGNYRVAVDGLGGSFTVVTSAPSPLDKLPISWPILGGIIVAIIVILLIIFAVKK